jgi:hypothetical protein
MADVLFQESELDTIPKLDLLSLVAKWEFWAANQTSRILFVLPPPLNIDTKDIVKAWKTIVDVPKTVRSAAQLRHLRKNTSLRQRWVLAFLQDYLNIQPANPNKPSSTVLDFLLAKSLYPNLACIAREYTNLTQNMLILSPRALAVVLTFPDKEKLELDFQKIFLKCIEINEMPILHLLLDAKNARGQYLIVENWYLCDPIAIAARRGYAEIVSLLMDAKTSDNTQFRFSDCQTNSLDIAAEAGNLEVVNLLLQAKTIDGKESRFDPNNAMDKAVESNEPKVVALLLKAKNINNKEFRMTHSNKHSDYDVSILAKSARYGYADIVSLLLEAKTVDKKEFRFNYAVEDGDDDFYQLIVTTAESGQADTLPLLLEAKTFDQKEFRFSFDSVKQQLLFDALITKVGYIDTESNRTAYLTVSRFTNVLGVLLAAKTMDGKEFRLMPVNLIREIEKVKNAGNEATLRTLLLAAFNRGHDIRNFVTSRYFAQLSGI